MGPFRLAGRAPPLAGRTIRRVLIIGDSNGNGTQTDSATVPDSDPPEALYAGVAIPATWSIVDQGAPLATWPAGGSPAPGVMPYLVDLLGAAETGWIVRESENGRALDEVTGWNAQLSDAFAAVDALDDGPPDLIYVPMGANDGGDAAEAGRVEGHVRRTLAILRDRWPDASILWLQERTTATPPSAYDLLVSVVHPGIATACAEVGAEVLDGESLAYAMADDIHAAQSPAGQGAIAAAIVARAES